MHSPAPISSLKVPGEQGSHGPPLAPVWPGSQTQSFAAALPAADAEFAGHVTQASDETDAVALEYVPASHASHSVAPFSSLNDPAGHAVHSCPSASAVYPALHTQSVTASLPLAEFVLAGHWSTHGSAPGVALYLPSSQASHGPP